MTVGYCNFAHSTLASFRMGMSESDRCLSRGGRSFLWWVAESGGKDVRGLFPEFEGLNQNPDGFIALIV
jgi:hypothetical protein